MNHINKNSKIDPKYWRIDALAQLYFTDMEIRRNPRHDPKLATRLSKLKRFLKFSESTDVASKRINIREVRRQRAEMEMQFYGKTIARPDEDKFLAQIESARPANQGDALFGILRGLVAKKDIDDADMAEQIEQKNQEISGLNQDIKRLETRALLDRSIDPKEAKEAELSAVNKRHEISEIMDSVESLKKHKEQVNRFYDNYYPGKRR